MKRLIISVLAGVVMSLSVVAAYPAPAQARLEECDDPQCSNFENGATQGCGGGVAAFFGFRSWDACLTKDANGAPIITSLNDIWKIAIMIVEFMIKAAGYLAVGFLIWGGIKYQKSQGEPGETTQARQIINNALMGLVICMISVAIIQFITSQF